MKVLSGVKPTPTKALLTGADGMLQPGTPKELSPLGGSTFTTTRQLPFGENAKSTALGTTLLATLDTGVNEQSLPTL